MQKVGLSGASGESHRLRWLTEKAGIGPWDWSGAGAWQDAGRSQRSGRALLSALPCQKLRASESKTTTGAAPASPQGTRWSCCFPRGSWVLHQGFAL